MKLFNRILIISSFAISALPVMAHAGEADPCSAIFEACAAQGFSKDEAAPAGKKIWLNCASPILIAKKKVAQVAMDPNGFDANNCRDYRKAKEKFDADWMKNHPKP